MTLTSHLFCQSPQLAAKFPQAHTAKPEDEVTVHCSNDYLGMGRHPVTLKAIQSVPQLLVSLDSFPHFSPRHTHRAPLALRLSTATPSTSTERVPAGLVTLPVTARCISRSRLSSLNCTKSPLPSSFRAATSRMSKRVSSFRTVIWLVKESGS